MWIHLQPEFEPMSAVSLRSSREPGSARGMPAEAPISLPEREKSETYDVFNKHL